MNINVLTPDRKIFQGEISSVKVPGTLGEFQVLNNHAPIVSSLEAGKVTLVTSGGFQIMDPDSKAMKESAESGRKITFKIKAGFIEVLNNEISLLVRGVSELM